jgi:hypothetical protein
MAITAKMVFQGVLGDLGERGGDRKSLQKSEKLSTC